MKIEWWKIYGMLMNRIDEKVNESNNNIEKEINEKIDELTNNIDEKINEKLKELESIYVSNVNINDEGHLLIIKGDGENIDSGLIRMLPEVTGGDEKKILKVVDGKWVLTPDSNDDDVSVLEVNKIIDESDG